MGTRNTVFRREPKTPTTGTEKTKGNWKNPRQELKNQIQEKKSAGKGKTHSGNQKNPTPAHQEHMHLVDAKQLLSLCKTGKLCEALPPAHGGDAYLSPSWSGQNWSRYQGEE